MRKRSAFLIPGAIVLGAVSYALLKRRVQPLPPHPFLAGPNPLAMAHRGGEGLWPPNTLYAYQKALDLGVDVLELDIHATADGALVVRHDDTVDRTTDGRGAIRSLSLAQIEALDAGYRWSDDGGNSFPYRGRGITVPTLEAVFAAFPDTRINIDIKPQDPAVVPAFVETLRRFGRERSVMVGSFHDAQLARFRALCPQTATAAGVRETQLFYGLNLARLTAIYQPRAHAFQIPERAGRLRIVTPGFVRAAHALGMPVHIWTVNESADMRRLLDWGVDGLFSDYPDRLMAVLGRQANAAPEGGN